MSLQINLHNRRQFLERSMLGFGGAFLLPSLLASCTDHGIGPGPGPDPNVPTRPLRDSNPDWNDAAKGVVIGALELGTEEIPGLGILLGALVDVFWPSGNSSEQDVWDQVKAQVEALVDQKIADQVYQDVQDDLAGLFIVIQDYRSEIALQTPNYAQIQSFWNAVKLAFDVRRPHFQSNGAAGDYRLLLLPLFAQYTNLYLALLRDPLLPVVDAQGRPEYDSSGNYIINGKVWGRTDAEQQRTAQDLKNAITDFTTYCATQFETGRTTLLGNTPRDDNKCEPFRSVNKFDREMTLTVLDYMAMWPLYDASVYPAGGTVKLDREILSDPIGNCSYSGQIFPAPPPMQFQPPVGVSIWSKVFQPDAWDPADNVQAIQVTYPPGGGPGGVTQTKRMGGPDGTLNAPINIDPTNPIAMTRTSYWVDVNNTQFLNSIQFYFNDETTPPTPVYGGFSVYKNPPYEEWGYEWELVSRIHVNGLTTLITHETVADSVVYGFRYWKSPSGTLTAIRRMYVTSPQEHSAADFAKAFPNVAIPADLITPALKAARQAHWTSVKVVAARPK